MRAHYAAAAKWLPLLQLARELRNVRELELVFGDRLWCAVEAAVEENSPRSSRHISSGDLLLRFLWCAVVTQYSTRLIKLIPKLLKLVPEKAEPALASLNPLHGLYPHPRGAAAEASGEGADAHRSSAESPLRLSASSCRSRVLRPQPPPPRPHGSSALPSLRTVAISGRNKRSALAVAKSLTPHPSASASAPADSSSEGNTCGAQSEASAAGEGRSLPRSSPRLSPPPASGCVSLSCSSSSACSRSLASSPSLRPRSLRDSPESCHSGESSARVGPRLPPEPHVEGSTDPRLAAASAPLPSARGGSPVCAMQSNWLEEIALLHMPLESCGFAFAAVREAGDSAARVVALQSTTLMYKKLEFSLSLQKKASLACFNIVLVNCAWLRRHPSAQGRRHSTLSTQRARFCVGCLSEGS
ncbi:chloride transporter, chloride channel (ClC) family protein [Besnoitia besnoiti]|uniref:Chloride transporter, chloride channel (ClC) family protein n=1 Tax=Besnoitia besnoiti TaxID=94643 RepID=A0A2A9M7G8_BESBE|nr:chloride transporter, chloride channel (ClC) family protein [Besnoitia besnoiti]PFH31312.1 chloride transporter, chloride channel (ClC) family protein [Besnoitia besnoiti]